MVKSVVVVIIGIGVGEEVDANLLPHVMGQANNAPTAKQSNVGSEQKMKSPLVGDDDVAASHTQKKTATTTTTTTIMCIMSLDGRS